MRGIVSFLLRAALHVAATATATVAVQSSAVPEWRMAGLAIFTAALWPVWRRRVSLQARLGAYAAGLVVGGGLPPVALLALQLVGRSWAMSMYAAVVVVTLVFVGSVVAGAMVPAVLLRRSGRPADPGIVWPAALSGEEQPGA